MRTIFEKRKYDNNYKKIKIRCNWQALNDFMPICIISEESHLQRSIAQKNRKIHTGGFKKGSIPWNKGNTGAKHSEETKRKISLAHMGLNTWTKGKIPWNKGKKGYKNKPHTDETKRKIGLANKGRIPWIKGVGHSDETKRKLSERFKGIHNSGSFKEGHSGYWRGKTRDDLWKKQASIRMTKYRPFMKCPVKDTKPERMMQLALSLHRIPFEKHKPITGQPDIFIEPNICVFVDGDHWHANPNQYDSETLIIGNKKAKDVWAREIQVNHELNLKGYRVIRIWESDILKDANNCANNIINLIQQLRGVEK